MPTKMCTPGMKECGRPGQRASHWVARLARFKGPEVRNTLPVRKLYTDYCGLTGEGVKSVLREVGIFHPQDFGDAMRAYLDMPVGEALKSSDPFIKAFAMVDRRVGKRTLANLELSESEHAPVKAFYKLRLASAHI